MNTCKYSIDDLNVDLKTIVRQIEIESYSPELILSINRGGCIPGIYLSLFESFTRGSKYSIKRW